MEFSLLLLVIGFVVLVYLIFKFIKKAVFAVITLVLLLVVIFGGVLGLVYLDLNNIASQNDYDVKIVLAENGEYILGANVPVRNESLDFDEVHGISQSEISEIEPTEINDGDNFFVVEIEKEFLEEIMVDSYSFEELGLPSEFSGSAVVLTKSEILSLMDEGSDPDELSDILIEKNNISEIEALVARPLFVGQFETYMDERNMDFRSAVFLVALTGSLERETNVLLLIDGYKKEGGIEIYPDRFTFKLVRLLPAGTIIDFLGVGNNS